MKWPVKYGILLLMFFFGACLHAQSDEAELLRGRIEKYIENTESTLDYTDLYDQIEWLMQHPVNINRADMEGLAAIPLMTPAMIQALLDHRSRYGQFTSIYELQQLEGFDPERIRLILPFITVAEVISADRLKKGEFLKNGQHEIIALSALRPEKSKGYQLPANDPNAYTGNPLHQVLRYKGTLGEHVLLSFISEKDAGEKTDLNSMFTSGGVLIRNAGRLKTLNIGDYQAAFGQGLTFGSGLAFGKSPFVLNMMRTQNGIRAYHSLNENEFLRGVGATYMIRKNIDFTCFYSGKKIDGTLQSDSSFIGDGFSSLVNTGYHRSANEMAKKGAVGRHIAGTHLSCKFRGLELGFTAVETFFTPSILPSAKPYQKYQFSGSNIVNMGTDYKYYYKNLILYGEISANAGFKNISTVNGLLMSLGKRLDLSLLQRHYAIGYMPSITNAIGEASDNKNENGMYAGFSLNPAKGYTLNAYSDIYRFAWLRYMVDAPSSGKDILVELQYAKRKSYSWYVRFRNESKQMNEEGTQHLNRMEYNDRTQLRFHIEHNVSPFITIRNRVEFVRYHLQYGKTTAGFLMFQDISFAAGRNLKISGRIMYFDVQDYDARLYAYENDMLYTYSVPAFQNRGTRFYILAKYKLKRNIDIWTRIAMTGYEDVEVIGSGYDQIAGHRVTDIKIQLKWTL